MWKITLWKIPGGLEVLGDERTDCDGPQKCYGMNEQTESWLDVRLVRFYAVGIFQNNFNKVTFFAIFECSKIRHSNLLSSNQRNCTLSFLTERCLIDKLSHIRNAMVKYEKSI